MNLQEVSKGKRVKYDGFNRKYLNSYPVAKLSGEKSSLNQSAFVEFFDEGGNRLDSAWVGVQYLSLLKFTHQETIDELAKKRDELKGQIAGFDAAIKALEDLG